MILPAHPVDAQADAPIILRDDDEIGDGHICCLALYLGLCLHLCYCTSGILYKTKVQHVLEKTDNEMYHYFFRLASSRVVLILIDVALSFIPTSNSDEDSSIDEDSQITVVELM
jgi:hypothetical protein